jgi:hypothetical protein
MTARSTHFKVDNGDMLLLRLESGRRVLVDINIRSGDDIPDVLAQLRARLTRDSLGRLYVDAFALTHPDADHCRGLQAHFHLGPPSEWKKADDKILIREMWSSPIVFRRADRKAPLCDDAKAWATEARRRVRLFREVGSLGEGDKILVLGEDDSGKTDDLGAILVRRDGIIDRICGVLDGTFTARLIAPAPPGTEEEEERRTKNNSSVILNVAIAASGYADAARYLIGGDAEVAIWEAIHDHYASTLDRLTYDILVAPHHCSWRSLSYHSWSDLGEKAKVNWKARTALAQTRPGARILASSKAISDNDSDPPCIRAKREYIDILGDKARFECLADDVGDEPVEFDVKVSGPSRFLAIAKPAIIGTVAATPVAAKPYSQHG